MILASHYVIEDLLYMLKSGDLKRTKKLCEKFGSRYKNDSDLLRICNMVLVPEEVDDKLLEDVQSRFKELSNARRLETSGGTRLWFEKRR
ncbi:MAG: hypothetical protein U9Q22_03530 [Candidatus Altiarchaeota archaeon]|nr:hypothetical protein [Candidatus Altiarchaeota archaeon]